MDAGLERLSQTMPHRYCRDAVGHWRCPPGERFAAHFGLVYRLRSSSEIDWVLQRNLRFLNDYLIKPPSVDRDCDPCANVSSAPPTRDLCTR